MPATSCKLSTHIIPHVASLIKPEKHLIFITTPTIALAAWFRYRVWYGVWYRDLSPFLSALMFLPDLTTGILSQSDCCPYLGPQGLDSFEFHYLFNCVLGPFPVFQGQTPFR